MTPLREWLTPPRSLLLTLFLLTLVSISALVWFGWKLLEQERIVEVQRNRERLEQAADRITANLQGTLAETGERLGAWLVDPTGQRPPEEGLLLMLDGGSFSAQPAERLLYRPFVPVAPEAAADIFASGEALEFQQGQPAQALGWYRRLAEAADASVRAGALLREARILRRSGNAEESRGVYAQLAAIGEVRVAGAPCELVARHAMAELSGRKVDAEALKRDLLRGRWPLTRGQFAFYWSESSRLAGGEEAVPAEPAQMAEAVALAAEALEREPGARGQSTLWVDGHPFLLIWRGVPDRTAALVARPEAIVKARFSGDGVFYAAVDGDGRVVAGKKQEDSSAAVRTPVESRLPWTLYVTAAQGSREAGMFARQRFLLLVTAVMGLFLVAGFYFIGRAIRRDLEVTRMQSDFVAAVSHEFRSPLTSMRQLSEILALGRVPNEERRQMYYETLVKETKRLQRLVEALLNFGRMEAGVRKYHFEELDAVRLVERVVAEFEPQIAESGRHIELAGATAGCRIDADAEALSVALRNLVDNALKYSPDCPTVWVECGPANGHVAIRVRDEGVGIAASERRAIFRKFVRGSAAAAANVKGSGVGLSMVRHIVAAHGGEITLASEPGRGSTFTILLPAGAEMT